VSLKIDGVTITEEYSAAREHLIGIHYARPNIVSVVFTMSDYTNHSAHLGIFVIGTSKPYLILPFLSPFHFSYPRHYSFPPAHAVNANTTRSPSPPCR
jgi:hypothetical protein